MYSVQDYDGAIKQKTHLVLSIQPQHFLLSLRKNEKMYSPKLVIMHVKLLQGRNCIISFLILVQLGLAKEKVGFDELPHSFCFRDRLLKQITF